MNRTQYEEMLNSVYSTSADMPFGDDQSIHIFRHADNKKWFAAVMTVPCSYLGIKRDGKIDIVNLKCAVDIIDSMWIEDGVVPAYHMNKRHWVSVALDGSAKDETIRFLTEISYDLTKTKTRPRK